MNNESDEESDISTDEYEVDHDDTHSTTDESISDSDRDSDGEFQGKWVLSSLDNLLSVPFVYDSLLAIVFSEGHSQPKFVYKSEH